jgi:hypothetical protein
MSAPHPRTRTAIVLVHGSWHGAWCWHRVLPLLRQAGVDTHAVTLTGVGERAHLLSPRWYSHPHPGCHRTDRGRGTAACGAGGAQLRRQPDHLRGRPAAALRPGLLRHLVYLDAGIPNPGDSWSSNHSPETVAKRVAEAQASGGLSFPPPDASVFGLTGADRDWVNRRQTPQPFRLYQEPLDFDPALVWASRTASSTAPTRHWPPSTPPAGACAASRAGRSTNWPPGTTRWSARRGNWRSCCWRYTIGQRCRARDE